MTDRELGAAASVCPNCGSELEAVALPDGGVTVSACPSCYPAEEPKQAPEKAKRQQPMVSREQGTPVDAPESGEGVNQ